ncbi:hypothetical protein Nmel_018477 [Mimus melanotis]
MLLPWALPLPVGWGWPQGTGLVTIGAAWEVAVGACSPLTHRALPVPGWELQHTRVPQPWAVACPLGGCSVCPHCVFQCWQRSQCPGALSRPHVSTGSCCQGLLLPVALLSQAFILVCFSTGGGLGSCGCGEIPAAWGLTLSPAQPASAALLWGWLCHISGDLLGSRPGSLWPPSCHSVLLPCQSPLGFPLLGVPCAWLESTVEEPVLMTPLCQGSRAKTK